MMNEIFSRIRHFLIPFELQIYKRVNSLLIHIGNIPGFGKVSLGKTCCEFHYIQNFREISYEPNFTRICNTTDEQNKIQILEMKEDVILEKNTYEFQLLSDYPYGNFSICNEGVKNLIKPIKSLQSLINTNKLQYYKVSTSFMSKSYIEGALISRVGSTSIVCLVDQNGFISPILTNFKNLSGGSSPFINILWDFKLLNCCLKQGKHQIDINVDKSLSLSEISQPNCEIVEINMNKFSVNFEIEDDERTQIFGQLFTQFQNPLKLTLYQGLEDNVTVASYEFPNQVNLILKTILLLMNFMLLFAPFSTVLSLQISLKKNFSKQKNCSFAIFLIAFTIFSVYSLKQ